MVNDWPHDYSYYELAAQQIGKTIEIISNKRTELFGLPPWIVTWRVKEEGRVKEKIERKRKTKPGYSISSMTDLAGVRAVVDGIHAARRLEEFFRKKGIFPIHDQNSEAFIDIARPDGYRGIHLVLEVEVTVAQRITIPLELQIRTSLQHQWAELSKSEFYKSIAEIPPLLLGRMRSLSDILFCADKEADELRRARILDEGTVGLARLLRAEVLERLAPGEAVDPPTVGLIGILVVEIEKQLRRALVSDGREQVAAFEALQALSRRMIELYSELADKIIEIVDRVRTFVEALPQDW